MFQQSARPTAQESVQNQNLSAESATQFLLDQMQTTFCESCFQLLYDSERLLGRCPRL
jgi:hypothetical protein